MGGHRGIANICSKGITSTSLRLRPRGRDLKGTVGSLKKDIEQNLHIRVYQKWIPI